MLVWDGRLQTGPYQEHSFSPRRSSRFGAFLFPDRRQPPKGATSKHNSMLAVWAKTGCCASLSRFSPRSDSSHDWPGRFPFRQRVCADLVLYQQGWTMRLLLYAMARTGTNTGEHLRSRRVFRISDSRGAGVVLFITAPLWQYRTNPEQAISCAGREDNGKCRGHDGTSAAPSGQTGFAPASSPQTRLAGADGISFFGRPLPRPSAQRVLRLSGRPSFPFSACLNACPGFRAYLGAGAFGSLRGRPSFAVGHSPAPSSRSCSVPNRSPFPRVRFPRGSRPAPRRSQKQSSNAGHRFSNSIGGRGCPFLKREKLI